MLPGHDPSNQNERLCTESWPSLGSNCRGRRRIPTIHSPAQSFTWSRFNMITFWQCNPWHAGLRGVVGEQKQCHHHHKLLTSRFGANIEIKSTGEHGSGSWTTSHSTSKWVHMLISRVNCWVGSGSFGERSFHRRNIKWSMLTMAKRARPVSDQNDPLFHPRGNQNIYTSYTSFLPDFVSICKASIQ